MTLLGEIPSFYNTAGVVSGGPALSAGHLQGFLAKCPTPSR